MCHQHAWHLIAGSPCPYLGGQADPLGVRFGVLGAVSEVSRMAEDEPPLSIPMAASCPKQRKYRSSSRSIRQHCRASAQHRCIISARSSPCTPAAARQDKRTTLSSARMSVFDSGPQSQPWMEATHSLTARSLPAQLAGVAAGVHARLSRGLQAWQLPRPCSRTCCCACGAVPRGASHPPSR